MTTLASAVAIGDTQLTINAPLADGSWPALVKIDSEILRVGGAEHRTGTILTLSDPATATHSNGATLTYAGNPYDADFLAATGGGGGAGGVTVDNQSDAPAAVTTLIAPGATISGDEATLGWPTPVEINSNFHVFSEEVEKFRVTGSGVSAFDSTETKRLRVYDADVVIYDSDGNPALQVNADGSVHIKTGTSILADL